MHFLRSGVYKGELIQENSENIDEHISEMGRQVTEDTAEEAEKRPLKGISRQ